MLFPLRFNPCFIVKYILSGLNRLHVITFWRVISQCSLLLCCPPQEPCTPPACASTKRAAWWSTSRLRLASGASLSCLTQVRELTLEESCACMTVHFLESNTMCIAGRAWLPQHECLFSATSTTSMVMSGDHPGLTFTISLVRTEPTYNQPMQQWSFVSDFAVSSSENLLYISPRVDILYYFICI